MTEYTPTTDLRRTFEWTCPECGSDHYDVGNVDGQTLTCEGCSREVLVQWPNAGVVPEEPEWDGPHIPGPGDIMLMLAYWRSQDEPWAQEASAELVARFPALDVERDADGRVVIGDDYELAALHKAESQALARVHAAWRASRAPVEQDGE